MTLDEVLSAEMGPWAPALWLGLWGTLWLVGYVLTEWNRP